MTPRETSPEAFFAVARTRADRPAPNRPGRTPPQASIRGRGAVHRAGRERTGAFAPLPTWPTGIGPLVAHRRAAGCATITEG